MLWKNFNMLGLLALMLVWPAIGWAEPQQTAPDEQQMGKPALPEEQTQEGQVQEGGTQGNEQRLTRELQGKVVDEKDVSIEGGQAKNKIVLMEFQNGERLAVDLGPVDALKDRVKVGDSATVEGRLIRVGEDPVFLATQLNVAGQSFKVERRLTESMGQGQQEGQAQEQQGGQPREYEFTGTIEDEKCVDCQNNTQNKVVLLRTDEGKTVLVDLGPMDKLQNIELGKGAQVSVKGHVGSVDETSILFVDQLNAGGQNLKIDRPDFE